MKLNKKYLTVTIDEKALVKQAVEANLEKWKMHVDDCKLHKQFAIDNAKRGDTVKADYWKHCAHQSLAEQVTIQETIERIFPNHEDLIAELFYSHYN